MTASPFDTFPFDALKPLSEKLNSHPIYEAVTTEDDLRVFMEHHVFSVWDFMSLLMGLKQSLAPVQVPWMPVGDAEMRRFINEISLEEDTDQIPPDQGLDDHDHLPRTLSHFELYQHAMDEVEARTSGIKAFVAFVRDQDLETALALNIAPPAARRFMTSTFAQIASNKPHVIAAAFAFGREHIIPSMFSALLEKMAIREEDAPAFHFYLKRHIHLDEGEHGPMALRMVDKLIGVDPIRIEEALEAARTAMSARIALWDAVMALLPSQRAKASSDKASRDRTS